MVVECPHCFTRVIPSEQATCPACGKNIKDREGANPDLTKLTISTNDRLPRHCCICDSPSVRTVTIRHSEVKGQGTPLVFRMIMFFCSPVLAIIFSKSNRFRHTIKLRLPHCASCAKNRAVTPAFIDLEEGTFTFVVHKSFRDRVDQLNH